VTSDEPSGTFTIEGGEVAQGELLEVNIVAASFVDLTLFEFNVLWDSSVYSFIDLVNVANNIPDFDYSLGSNFGLPGDGSIVDGQVVTQWSKFDGELSLNPNTVLFTIILEAVGNACDTTSIAFNGAQAADPDFNDINPVLNNSELTISGSGCTPLPHTCELLAVVNPICNGGSGTITVDVQADETCTCNWYQNGTLIQSTAANSNCDLEDFPAGTYIFELTSDTDDVLCTFNQILVEPNAFSISSTVVDEDCTSLGSIELNVTGGIGTLSYEWLPDVSDTDDATSLQADTYFITITDENGCSATTQETVITDIEELEIDANSIIINGLACFGDADGSIIVEATGGCPDYNYTWSDGNGEDLTAGSYMVTVTDASGNTATEVFDLLQPTELTSTFEISGSANNEINVTPSGGVSPYSFAWMPNVSTSETASDLNGGLYNVTITDTNGCTTSISDMEIIEDTTCPPIAWVSVPSDMTISCSDIASIDYIIDFSSEGTDDCDFGGSVMADTTVTRLGCDILINLQWTATADGVTIDTQQLITINDITDPVWIDAPADTSVDCQDIQSINNQLAFSNGLSGICEISGVALADLVIEEGDCNEDRILTWSSISTDGCYVIPDHIQRVAVVGCFDIDLNFFITDEILEDIVPTNYLSPNGDGQNDVLRFTGEDVMDGAELWIYNRWGDQLYHKENYTNDWDASGIPSGVYYYVLRLEGATLKRTITILK